MTSSKPAAPLTKGQLRCFECRKGASARDGHWENQGNQQVFVCKVCEHARLKPAKRHLSHG